MARTLPNTIENGDDFDADPVQENFDNLNNRFGTGSTGIANTDIYTSANIATTKIMHGGAILLSTFLNAEHTAATGAHTFATNGCEGLYIKPNASNPTFALSITAEALTLVNSAGTQKRITSVSEAVNLTSGQAENGTLLATAEAISTGYHLLVLYDTTASTATAVFYPGLATTDPADVLGTTFWETDLPAYNTALGGGAAYNYAKCVGWVYNDADGDLEAPKAIGGGTVGSAYTLIPALMVIGSYAGTGAGQSITGVGFKPDFVLVGVQKDESTQGWVIKTASMSGAYSKTTRGQYDTDFITSLDDDGFTISTDNGVSESGRTFVYIALKIHKGL